MMILLDQHSGLAVNPAMVGSIRFSKFNGSKYLVITMKDGFEVQVAHRPETGVDVAKLHFQLLEAV
jgi:hypothetical protein